MKLLLTLLLTTLSLFSQIIEKNTPISLTIRGVPQEESVEFNGQYIVYENGMINIPLLGSMRAAGMTPSALAKEIESRYRAAEIYTKPTVNADYDRARKSEDEVLQDKERKRLEQEREDAKRYFTLRRQQGSSVITFRDGLTLQDAIAAGGGGGTFDSKKRAILERNGKEYEYDMENIQHRNVKIYPKDVIKLPHINKDSGIFRIFGGGD